MRRLAAFFLDGLILGVIGFAVLAVSTFLLGPTVRLQLDVPASPVAEVVTWRVVVNALLLSTLSAAYFVTWWSWIGRTPGQFALRLVVVSATGPVLSAGRAALRWSLLGAPLGVAAALTVEVPLLFLAVAVLSFVWFAVLVLTTLLSRSGRGLHDRLAGTTVVHRDA
jgi:uncharacterized RDD family membrane protein YckC